MGNPFFYYYPSGDTLSLETIDLGAGLSDLQVTPVRIAEDSYTLAGGMHRITQGGYLEVRIVFERFTDAALAYKLESMWAHLELGGLVGFATDSGKAFAGYATAEPARGDSSINIGGNAFQGYTAGAAALANDDILAIHSLGPGTIREYCAISSISVLTYSLTDSIRYDYPAGLPVMVRHRDFFPALRAPSTSLNANPVTHDHRVSYTLDLTLEEASLTLEAGDDLTHQGRLDVLGGLSSSQDIGVLSPDIFSQVFSSAADSGPSNPRRGS